MEYIYYTVAIVAYSIFIIKFIVSFIMGELDVDLDGDAEPEFDVSSLLSFKGLLHFSMGCFGWLAGKQYKYGEVTTSDVVIAVLLGIVFVIVLYWIYKLCTRFQHVPTKLEDVDPETVKNEIIGRTGRVFCVTADKIRVTLFLYGENNTIECESSSKNLNVGQIVTIKGYNENSKLYQI